MSKHSPLQQCLFFMRASVFLVMAVWALDKFIDPGHAGRVWAHFYFVQGMQTPVIYTIGALQITIYLGFLFGVKKRVSTLLVLLMHAGSTLLSYEMYLNPWAGSTRLLFFAAWPMLAACYALYILRDSDTMFSLNIR